MIGIKYHCDCGVSFGYDVLVRRSVVLVNMLKLAPVHFDSSNLVETLNGMTNTTPDRANVTVNMIENGEENSIT